MSRTLYWLQCSASGGDSTSLFDIESPNIVALLGMLDIEVLWHPSLSGGSAAAHAELLAALMAGEQPLTFLCVEGAVIRGPFGTGMYDTFQGRPKKDLVSGLARRAKYVVAAGTCASFGGIGAGWRDRGYGRAVPA